MANSSPVLKFIELHKLTNRNKISQLITRIKINSLSRKIIKKIYREDLLFLDLIDIFVECIRYFNLTLHLSKYVEQKRVVYDFKSEDFDVKLSTNPGYISSVHNKSTLKLRIINHHSSMITIYYDQNNQKEIMRQLGSSISRKTIKDTDTVQSNDIYKEAANGICSVISMLLKDGKI